MDFKKAKEFIYRNARPVEFALWRFYMENGSLEDVLTCLSFHQNEDGGFGHAIEPDSFNPFSAPLETCTATKTLWDIGCRDSSHPIIQGVLRYLDSGNDYQDDLKQWNATVPTNDDYPHAYWWNYEEPKEYTPNPTAALAGFILFHAPKESDLWEKGKAAAINAYEWLVKNYPIHEDHQLGCYIQLFDYLDEGGITDVIDLDDLKKRLIKLVPQHICQETERWGKEYVALPSRFIRSRDSILYPGNEEIVEAELAYLATAQQEDGAFRVTWQWYNDFKQFELAANWWKSIILLENVTFAKAFLTDAAKN